MSSWSKLRTFLQHYYFGEPLPKVPGYHWHTKLTHGGIGLYSNENGKMVAWILDTQVIDFVHDGDERSADFETRTQAAEWVRQRFQAQ